MEECVLERLDSLRIELANALGPMKPIFPLASSSELLPAAEKQERTTSQGLVRDAVLKGQLILLIRCDGEWIALPRHILASPNVDWYRTVSAGKLFRFSMNPDYCDGADIFVDSARWRMWKANKLKKRIDGYMPRPRGRKGYHADMIDEATRLLTDRPRLRLREAATLIEGILSKRFPGQDMPKSRSIENVIRGMFKDS